MSLYWIIGFAVGIVLVAIFCTIARKKNKAKGVTNDGYDERQVAARGKCYQTAFFSLFFLEVALGLLDVALGSPVWMQGPVLHMLAVFLGATIFACMAVFNDAYFRPSDKTPGAIILFSVLGIADLFLGIKSLTEGRVFNEAGQLGSAWYNLIAAVFLMTVAGCMIIKQVKDKKAVSENDAE